MSMVNGQPVASSKKARKNTGASAKGSESLLDFPAHIWRRKEQESLLLKAGLMLAGRASNMVVNKKSELASYRKDDKTSTRSSSAVKV